MKLFYKIFNLLMYIIFLINIFKNIEQYFIKIMNQAFDVLIDQRYNKYLEANINKNLFEVVRIKLQDD